MPDTLTFNVMKEKKMIFEGEMRKLNKESSENGDGLLNRDRCKMLGMLIFGIILFWLLFVNYRENWFHIIEEAWFDSWQLDSEELVVRKIQEVMELGPKHIGGFLGSIGHEYPQQIGLQGIIYSFISTVVGGKEVSSVLSLFYSFNVLMMCGILFLYLLWVYREFGCVTTFFTYILICLNSWLLVSARNLYWITFTLFVPFLGTLLLFQWEEKNGKKYSNIIAIFIFISIALRCACGYEFISTVMVSVELPLIYYAVKSKWELTVAVKRFLTNGLAALFSFISVLVMHIIKSGVYYNSFSRAISILTNTVAKRTGFGNLESVSEIYMPSLEASKWSVLYKYLFAQRPLLGGMHMGGIVVVLLLLMLLMKIKKFDTVQLYCKRSQLKALSITFYLSLVAPISWYVLASAHSYIHLDINYILWSLPTLLLGDVFFVEMCRELLSHVSDWFNSAFFNKL